MSHRAQIEASFHRLRHRLEGALASPEPDPIRVHEVASAMIDLAASLETWCREAAADPAEHVLLAMRGGELFDPFDLLKDVRERAAFQLRILAEESRGLAGSRHHGDYLERVRSFAEEFQ
jgi:hypothetical protein